MKRFLLWGVTLAMVSLPDLCVAQTGAAYRVVGNSIRVTRASEWNNWIFQNDLVSSLNVPLSEADVVRVETDGMRPVLFQREINVAPTAGDFSYTDVVRAGGDTTFGSATVKSNDRLASNVIDDDLSTYWEPDTPTNFSSRLRDPGDFHIDGLRNWELEVDLGRLVFADSVTIIFPAGQFEDEFLGEPVKSMALFASMGERFPFPLGNNLRFSLVGQRSTGFGLGEAAQQAAGLVPTPGTDGRYVQMNFPLEPLDRADWDLDGLADITGGFIQYVRVKIIDSDLWRDAYLGAGDEGLVAYEALAAEQRGALVYQRRTAGGLLVELQADDDFSAEERYETLPEGKRGPILYYVKEVPRISEVKVWARGNNYAYRPERRAGASFEHGGLGAPQLATDGVYDTEWAANTWSPVYVKGTAWYDLGATFWVDNISVVNKKINQSHLGAFLGPEIRVADGTLLKPLNMDTPADFTQLEEALSWDNVISEGHIDNHTPVVRVFQEDFPMRKIRFLQLRDIDITGLRSGRYGSLATLAEIQLYGEGYPTSVWAYSPPISLTDAQGNFIRKTLPRIAWNGDAIIRDTDPITGELVERIESLDLHPDVRLQIQTRTSDQTDSLFTYFQVVEASGDRQEVPKDIYDATELEWLAWGIWQTLPTSQRHESRTDDDGDGLIDEDPIDLIDNDEDGRIDEDGKKLRRAPRLTTAIDGELAFIGWSEWSESYLPTRGLNQATVTSPNPRKFIQVRINISSENPRKTARIRSLRIDLAPPLALELAGELALLNEQGVTRGLIDLDVLPEDYSPPRDIDPLQAQRFSYFTRASAPDPTVPDGFNEILVVTPLAASLTGVRIGQVRVAEEASPLDPTQMLTSAVTTRFDRAFAAGVDGVLRDTDGVALTRVATQTPDSIWVRFPFSLNDNASSRSHALIEVQFESQNFREGIEVASFVRSTNSEEGVFQRVDADTEDATELVDSSTARVSLATLGGSLLQGVVMQPVFTPNGDGINDELSVQFTLLKVLEERPMEVMFYDLSGRLVGEGKNASVTETGTGKVGEQLFTWDGRDLGGNVVAPGIYLVRIKVEADDKDNLSTRLVHVAY
ncbi:MAG: hypothetical protein HN559_15755 [Gemmatimonadetes bacterium]|jgi:hypothetical protein|nr:hypothetical protein [Gemmatimonadota bacterium]MBT5588674.1 hypothetical protein [Gemmatimonadota bacterium]MBT5962542.1 hypothetical protein [Gemmatimonadota bacterium]MBT7596361.1 hypothetical protein [Gemmatimonadota bacterium]